MSDRSLQRKRRQILKRGASLAGACLLGTALGGRYAEAAKTSKAAFLYQDHPRDGKRCGDCRFFSVDARQADTGTCALVEGAIDRDGWCTAFSPKA